MLHRVQHYLVSMADSNALNYYSLRYYRRLVIDDSCIMSSPDKSINAHYQMVPDLLTNERVQLSNLRNIWNSSSPTK